MGEAGEEGEVKKRRGEGGENKSGQESLWKTGVGPMGFEVSKHKGDDGFGEGNFKALFESIEGEKIESGEIQAAE
mgnify:CR=1 FL=1